MGVSRSRDDYRLGKPVIQDIPSSCVLSSCFLRGAIFLFLDRDTRSERFADIEIYTEIRARTGAEIKPPNLCT